MKKMSILILVLGAFVLSAQIVPQDNLQQMEIQDRHQIDLLGRQCSKYDIKRFLLSAAPEDIGRQKALFETSRIVGVQDYSSTWQSIGPEGGNVLGMAFNPLNKNEVFAVADGYPGPIFKTVDSGLTWTKISSINQIIFGIAVDPISSNTIYVPAASGIYKSLDGGENWRFYRFCSGFYCSPEGEITINPINPSILYLAGECHESSYSGMAVLKSVDGGENWSGMKLTPASQNAYGYTCSVAIDPSSVDTIYAGGLYYDGSNYLGKLYKTIDGGQNWTDITGSIMGYVESIVIDPKNPSKVFVGTGHGIYRSSEGGQIWQKNSDDAYAYALAIDPSDHNILYAGGNECCYKSADGGVNWTSYSGELYGSCNKLLVSSASATRVFYASKAGIYRSDDGSITWKASHSGIRACIIQSLAIAPSSPNIIYTDVGLNGFFKSENFGISWQRLLDFTWNITKIAVNPNDARNLFIIASAADGNGVYKSVDGGLTWTKKFGGYCDDLIINKNNINHVFIASHEEIDSTYIMALHKSVDGGNNWNTYKITTTKGYGYSVAIDSTNDDVIYVGGYSYAGSMERGVLFKSLDGGGNWTQIGTDITSPINAVAVDPHSSNIIYVGTYSGLYKSEDSGSSWRRTSSFEVRCIKISSNLTNEIFAAGTQGVYLSNDSGNSWNELNEGLTCMDVVSLDMDVPGSILYAGTYGGSVFKNSLLGLYSIVINAGLGGTTDPSPGIYRYDPGKEITIRATANTDYRFSQWSGDVSQGHEKDNPLTIKMDSDKSITANFIRQYTLTLASGTGGTTDPAPGSYKYDTGTQVTLTAIENSGYKFSGWSGDVSGTTNPIIITMDSNKTITANFTAEEEKKGCFIATAAYGSPLHPSVKILRDFRDEYLMSNKIGRMLVHYYYKHSPRAAGLISKHKSLRFGTRLILLPVIAFSYSILRLGPIVVQTILGLIFALLLFLIRKHYQTRTKSLNEIKAK